MNSQSGTNHQIPPLGFSSSENPFVVEHGGFYRRWLAMIDDVGELQRVVASLEGSTEDLWVPVFAAAGNRHEQRGDMLAAAGDTAGARAAYLQAKTYYAIGRYPGEISPVKRAISDDCARAYRKASAFLEPPLHVVEVEHTGKVIRAHFRAPHSNRPLPAVLIMCGADVFKEDRGWAQDLCMDNGLASLVMDGPGTGETPFPWAPESVGAWVAAVEYLAGRPEVDASRIGAFGISRGGYSVLQLAGTVPDQLGAVVASAGHPFGYVMTDEELDDYVAYRNQRASWKFGAPDGPPSFPPTTPEEERQMFGRWALSELGLVDNITMPVLMINGKHDRLAPVGNIYFMLENGPVASRSARIYADAGHCAFKYISDWGPASFRWLAEKLGG